MKDLGPIPRITTDRLLLRAFCLYDVKNYCNLAFEPNVLLTTDMPHEISQEAVREWIMHHPEAWRTRGELFLLMTDKETREVIGALSLFTYQRHNKADLGYWVAEKFWGQGLATEAASAVVDFAFNKMKLHKLEANHMTTNPSSAKVLKKMGFCYEGHMRETYLKGDDYVDLLFYGLLKSDYQKDK